jgi:carboxypeptidase C (cathepsin A)
MRTLIITLAAGLAIAAPLLTCAQEKSEEAKESKPPEKKEEGKPEEKRKDEKKEKEKEEKPKESRGSVTIGGKEIKYLAKTGMMPLLKEDGSGERASVFFVYYAVTNGDGQPLAKDAAGKRPITYCFNGGPGSAAVWLHFGGLGPKKVDLAPDGLTPSPRAAVVPNPNSILDVTDLVFIDPVGTGASRPAKGEKAEQFWGVDEDVESVGEFVRLFTTREQRWASPKYLCGESYGGIRASGLAQFLQNRHGFFLDGVVSISGVLNFESISGGTLGLINYLPAYTATAHYHKKLPPDLQSNRDKAIVESRAFAQGEYASALIKGNTLPTDQRVKVIAQLARFTGLDADLIDRANLRITSSLFFKNLLRKEGKIIGRFDGRVVAEDADRISPSPEFDPSYTNVYGPFSAAANGSIRGDLGYEWDLPYRILGGVNWSYSKYGGRYVNVEDRLAEAMKDNPKMRVMLCLGWRDLAVPPDSTLYSIGQLRIPDSLRGNIRVEYYESGHMMYLNQPDAEKLRRDLVSFIGQS